MRVCGPDHCLEVSTPNGLARRNRRGTFELNRRDARALVAEGGFIPADMGVATSPDQGFRCVECGFGSWFKSCSKCGGECFRETDN
jgi:hypothetical protein